MRDVLFIERDDSSREDVAEHEACSDAKASARFAKRERLRETARKEVEWFFGALGGRVPDEGSPMAHARPGAILIDRYLEAISAFHRGALALRYTPREWPPSLVTRHGRWTSLVVRLDCALHPSGGGKTTAELEKAAAERLEEAPAHGEALMARAEVHEHLAIRACAKARGEGPSLAPRGRARRGHS